MNSVAPHMKIISGGQTGVDRAALDAALAWGVPCGGMVPRGRLAEDGPLDVRYPVEECDSEDYAVRTELNVLRSDATLILYRGRKDFSGGTLLTFDFCKKRQKPVQTVDLETLSFEAAVRVCRDFIRERAPRVLNVAGPRDSKSQGIYECSYRLLLEVLRPI
ncbi:MAG: putative molybdenum carrier protein [Elusimicrobia bacterium]|nr:putative molybdenum carrier protein [Elusimicrobiota bacterium]